MTGEVQYMDLYFEEAMITKRREKALDTLKRYFDKTETFGSLKAALSCSQELMNSEYYAMRLVAEATGMDKNTWPQEVAEVLLSETDSALGAEGKIKKAQQMVCDNTYQEARTEIEESVTSCMDSLIEQTKNRQGRATSIFSDMYRKLEISIVLQVILTLVICLIVRKLVVRPLISYNENIKKGEIFPVIGASELQKLAETYNKIYQENQETQKLIRHQAEHDALTGTLNRGSFEKILHIYEEGAMSFALLLIDVDIFKSVNDTYGHAAG
ncbi:MAG: GGDEF domain-containing protein, partial [Lachnospiraceae bacterium]|nr:GGDEF domain-containing protein [Lachnospiraceae bacterium]